MKLEQRLGHDGIAAPAVAAKQRHGSTLGLASRADDGIVVRRAVRQMPPAVTVRADEVAFRGLGPDPRRNAANAAQGEVFGSSVPMVELEGGGCAIVTAVMAMAASRRQ